MVYIIFLKVVTMQCTTLSVKRKFVIPLPRTVITVITLLNIYFIANLSIFITYTSYSSKLMCCDSHFTLPKYLYNVLY